MEKPLNLIQEPSCARSIASPEAEYLLEDPAGFLYSIPSFLRDTFHGYISRASVRPRLFVIEKVLCMAALHDVGSGEDLFYLSTSRVCSSPSLPPDSLGLAFHPNMES